MILNLGCGVKTSASPDVTNIDWSIYLRLRRHRLLSAIVKLFLEGERKNRLSALPDNVMVYNLAKGLPFAANSIDVVYHSHMLEHFDRDAARVFLMEVKRVLKPGGIQRIVVPDFEKLCNAYVSHIAIAKDVLDEADKHDLYVAAVIEQSVRKEAFGTSRQTRVRRFVENVFLGDARRRGETHQWMYDRINLTRLLVHMGYEHVVTQDYGKSLIPRWKEYGLDTDEMGDEYKVGSLYIEAQKKSAA